jgi:hypothetical protein
MQPVANGPGLGGESLSAHKYLRLAERFRNSPALGSGGEDAMYTLAKAEVNRVTCESLPYAGASLVCVIASLWFFLKGQQHKNLP